MEQRYLVTVILRMLCAYDIAVNFTVRLQIETLLCVFVVIVAPLGKVVACVEEQAAPKHSMMIRVLCSCTLKSITTNELSSLWETLYSVHHLFPPPSPLTDEVMLL